jgi:hypothetical protein
METKLWSKAPQDFIEKVNLYKEALYKAVWLAEN